MLKSLAPFEETSEVFYPETDGEPMAETDTHRDLMADALIYPLKVHFNDRDDVYVSGNLLFYYEEGNPREVVAPDVFVVYGVTGQRRRIYKLWEEEKSPNVVIELTSRSTRRKDLGDKRLLYEELEVNEYFLFDPLREYLRPPLQGFRLNGLFYSPLEPIETDDGEWVLYSEQLQLELHTNGDQVRLYNPATGHYLRTLEETELARLLAEDARLEAEDARLEAEDARLEAEDARLEAEDARLEAEDARLEAEDAKEAAESALQAEREARIALEAELARLRKLLGD